MIKTAICKAAHNGLIVKAIVSDGLSANMKAAKLLGCDLNHRTPRTYFQHPHPKHKEQKIYFICDAAHMLKLMRNLLDERKCLLRRLPSNGTVIISWKYIEKLHELQSNESLYLANKLSGRHVNYSNVKMKVNIAAQTLSSSVAQAIAFLRDEMRHPEFAGSEATCHFIMIIDRLFDILNSKNPYAKGFKGALSEITKLTWKPSLLDSCQYLSSLCESDGTSIFDGKKSQGPLGFIVTATSVLQLADELLKEHNFQYFLTYKLSQDHLEVFFSKIRRRGGWNNNPNTEQFCAAYRAIIMNDSISVSSTGNSSNLDGTREIQVNLHSISQKASSTSTLDDLNADFAFVNVVDQMNSFFLNNDYEWKLNCLTYTGGFIVRRLWKQIKCTLCRDALLADKEKKTYPDQRLILFLQRKNNGGLLIPSVSVVRCLVIAEEAFRMLMPSPTLVMELPSEKFIDLRLQTLVLSRLMNERDSIFPDLRAHVFDHEISYEDDHISLLIRRVVSYYLRMKLYKSGILHHQRAILHGRSSRRMKCNKIVLFSGE